MDWAYLVPLQAIRYIFMRLKNNRKKMKRKIILVVGLSLLSFIGCSSSEPMLSSVADSKIVVDGNHEDWEGKLKYIDYKRVAVGFQNDDENLYLCLVTADKASAKKIIAFGLTIWFQPESNEETIGLLYPLPMDNGSSKNWMGMNKNNSDVSDFEMTINKAVVIFPTPFSRNGHIVGHLFYHILTLSILTYT